jgi:hypothetical protein
LIAGLALVVSAPERIECRMCARVAFACKLVLLLVLLVLLVEVLLGVG